LAIKNKKLAGAYYMPIRQGYDVEEDSILVGKNLDNDEIILAQDSSYNGQSEILPMKKGRGKNVTSEKNLSALLSYSKLISEKAVIFMEEGFIAPTPIENACEYCNYKAFCSAGNVQERKVGAISEEEISAIIDAEAENE